MLSNISRGQASLSDDLLALQLQSGVAVSVGCAALGLVPHLANRVLEMQGIGDSRTNAIVQG